MRGLPHGRSSRSSRKVLRNRWSRWTAIVQVFAHRRHARRRVDPAAYETLYGQLIDACRSLADSADGEKPGDTEGLEGLVRPWMNPRALAQADREILEGLLARCIQVERELGGRSWPPAALERGIKALPPLLALVGKTLLVALALVGLVALLRSAGIDATLIQDRAGGWAYAIWLMARRSTDLQRLAALTILVIPVAIFVVQRTARN